MKKLLSSLLFFCVLSFQGIAQENPIFHKGELSKTDNHTGDIWLSELNTPDSIFNFSLAQAIYAPAAKLDWHIHPAGQYLLITDGIGYYQERNKPVQTVRKGDVIKCLPGVEHWHSAAPTSSFAYVGVTPTQKGKTIWLKRVTNEEYNTITPPKENTTTMNQGKDQQAVIDLSKQKWQWMSDKNVNALSGLFDDKAMFVHMGGSWGKKQEIDVIKSGGIWYKKAEIYSVTVNIIGNTAILLNDIDLEAVVGGNTVVNPFMVTEVYINENGKWKMGSLTFSRLVREVKMKNDTKNEKK